MCSSFRHLPKLGRWGPPPPFLYKLKHPSSTQLKEYKIKRCSPICIYCWSFPMLQCVKYVLLNGPLFLKCHTKWRKQIWYSGHVAIFSRPRGGKRERLSGRPTGKFSTACPNRYWALPVLYYWRSQQRHSYILHVPWEWCEYFFPGILDKRGDVIKP